MKNGTKLILVLFVSALLIICLIYFGVLTSEAQQIANGNINFKANSIPKVNVYYEDYSFIFEYKTYFIRVRPFVIYNGSYYGMKFIVEWIKSNYPDVDYKWLIEKATDAIHYGFNLTRLPQNIADKIDYLGFRLVDLNFPLSWFSLDTFEMGYDIDENWDATPFNVTHIRIERANLILSFEDLYPYGYSIEHINSTYVLIGNVKGKTDLIVDPITYSAPRIIVVGTYTDVWENIYQADLTNGWGVSFKQGDNQYWYNASIQIGNGTVAGTTTASAIDDHVEIGDSTNNNGLTVCNYATLTLGTSNEPQRGGALIINGGGASGAPSAARWYGTANFYGVTFLKTSAVWLTFLGTADWKHVNFYGPTRIGWSWNANSNFDQCTIGFIINTSPATYDSCLFERDASICVRVGGSSSPTIQNSRFESHTSPNTEIQHWGDFTGTLNVTDCETDTDNWVWAAGANGTSNYQFTFNLNVTHQNGTTIQSANVTVWDGEGTELFSELTNSSGQIAEKTVVSSRFTGIGTETDYNPFNLTITYSGMDTYTKNFTLDAQTNWEIALTPTRGFTSGLGSGFLLAAIIMTVLGLAGLFYKSKK